MHHIALSVFVAVFLSACAAVGPDYQRPGIVTPENWRVDYPEAASVANIGWWTQFGDSALDALIETALRENRDIQAAAARVDQFIGALQTTRSQFYPQIGYNANASRNRRTEHGPAPLPPGTDPYYSLYRGSLGASWQIDLFGRIRRQSEAAQAQVFVSEQGRRGVILSVVTSVAASYIELRALDRQLAIVRASAANYADTLGIFELRYQYGVVSQVELAQAQSQYQLALSQFRQSSSRSSHRRISSRSFSEKIPNRSRAAKPLMNSLPRKFLPIYLRRCLSGGRILYRPSRTSWLPTRTSGWQGRFTTQRSRSLVFWAQQASRLVTF